MKKIHNKGICSKGNEDYVLNSNYNSLKQTYCKLKNKVLKQKYKLYEIQI